MEAHQEDGPKDPPKPSGGGRLGAIGRGIAGEARRTGVWVVRSVARGVLGLIVFGGLAWAFLPRPEGVPEGATLYVSLNRPLVEQNPLDAAPWMELFVQSPTLSAARIAEGIERAAEDPRIERIALSLDGMAGSADGAAARVAEAVRSARKAGKNVSAWASGYDNASWAIAAEANRASMHPMGPFMAGGAQAGSVYLGDALRRFGVEVAVGRAGRYKSAIEPMTEGAMSPDARAAMETALAGRLEGLARRGAEARGVDPESALAALSAVPEPGRSAAEAVEAGLIDAVQPVPAFYDEAFGSPGERSGPIAIGDYLSRTRDGACANARADNTVTLGEKADDKTLGILILEGEIGRGYSAPGRIGTWSAVGQIERFASDPKNAGLLLRIDSPGGEALAAEEIRESLARYRSMGRPVAISMGGAAASGGYWIATEADRIFAEATTLTGSIGVFSLRPSGAGVLERFAAAWDGVDAGRPMPASSLAEPLEAGEAEALQEEVDEIYARFTGLVAAARGLEISTAPDWAEGRVWAAGDALRIGLVDEIAGAGAALEWLSTSAGVPKACVTRATPVLTSRSTLAAFAPRRTGPLAEALERVEAAVSAAAWARNAAAARAIPGGEILAQAEAASSLMATAGTPMTLCMECGTGTVR